MHTRVWRPLALVGLLLSLSGWGHGAPQSGGDFANSPQPSKLPTDVVLVKGAWASASDSATPMPEGGRIANRVYINQYFRLTYALPTGWMEKYSCPPPSDSGYYFLAQIRPAETFKGTSRGSILIAAQDLFFTPSPAGNALELINYSKDKLSLDYEVEQAPTLTRIASHSFVRFDYGSPVAGLHWHVLATQIRCHMVQFVVASRDAKLMESLLQEMNKMTLPTEAGPISGRGGDDVPVCIKDYAREEDILERLDPVFTERRFNPVPVRIIVDKEGKVKHIHFLSAFPDQVKANYGCSHTMEVQAFPTRRPRRRCGNRHHFWTCSSPSKPIKKCSNRIRNFPLRRKGFRTWTLLSVPALRAWFSTAALGANSRWREPYLAAGWLRG